MFDPTITLLLITALVSAFNPYTTGVLILLCSVIYGRGHKPSRVIGLGIAYIATLFLASVLGGILILYLCSLLPMIAMNYLVLGIGILVVCAGLLEVKDFFWYGQGLSMGVPRIAATNIRALTKTRSHLGSAIALGLFVAFIVTPSSSAPYFATVTALRGEFNVGTISLLVFYTAIFCLPMIAMLLALGNGLKVSTLLRWKEETKQAFRLGVGLLLIALGWLLILIANGVVNIG